MISLDSKFWVCIFLLRSKDTWKEFLEHTTISRHWKKSVLRTREEPFGLWKSQVVAEAISRQCWSTLVFTRVNGSHPLPHCTQFINWSLTKPTVNCTRIPIGTLSRILIPMATNIHTLRYLFVVYFFVDNFLLRCFAFVQISWHKSMLFSGERKTNIFINVWKFQWHAIEEKINERLIFRCFFFLYSGRTDCGENHVPPMRVLAVTELI